MIASGHGLPNIHMAKAHQKHKIIRRRRRKKKQHQIMEKTKVL